MFEPRQVADLDSDLATRGYGVVTLMTPAEADDLLGRVKEWARDNAATTDAGRDYDFHASFLDRDKVYRRRVHRELKSLFDPLIAQLVPGYEVLLAGIFLKKPGAAHLPLHFDWTMVRDLRTRSINLWCPLMDVSRENGSLHVVEGSQRFVEHIGAPNTPPWFAGMADELSEAAKPMEIKAGQAVVYDSTLLHFSSANGSDQNRYVVALNCLPKGVDPVFYRRADDQGTRFELFDMSGDRFFDHDPTQFFSGGMSAPSLGFVDNNNRTLGLDDVQALLGNSLAATRKPASLWKTLLRRFNRG